MTAQEMFALMFGRCGRPCGRIAVLTAYFDDSGTHDGSPIVLMGGLVGNDAQWAELEQRWRDLLANPGDRWEPLKRFHMYDCEHGEGEFFGHTRGARDHLIWKFRNLILESGLHGYTCGVSVADWDELVTGDRRAAWGDAEQQCVFNCFFAVLGWASVESVEQEIAFVFDDRPHRHEASRRIHALYQYWSDQERLVPRPAGIAFLNSEKTIPLQAADMFAWESYRALNDHHKAPTKWFDGWMRGRPHFAHFLRTKRFYFSFANRPTIEAMLADVPEKEGSHANWRKISDYLTSASPDPSVLRLPRTLDRNPSGPPTPRPRGLS